MNNKIFFPIPLAILLSGFLYISNKGNQRASYECTEPEKVNSSLFKIRKGKTYFHFNQSLDPKKSKDFVWLEGKTEDYFTAYLINMSDSVFNAKKQDGSLIMTQEAMNEKGEWAPVEYWVPSQCGNSYFFPLELKPGRYVAIPVRQYKGAFKTQFRLKMRQGRSIFYSEPFTGTIEISQFEKSTENVHGVLYDGPANYLDTK